MAKRYVDFFIAETKSRLSLGHALKDSFARGYGAKNLKKDLQSGLIVALVSIPLAMALSVASGVGPEYGLYTVIVGGFFVALFGGSRFQVTGPTGAFIVVLVPIAKNFGLSGLLTAGFMAGIILLAMGIGRLGQFIKFIPYPVVTGFTAGIGLVIVIFQIPEFLGLKIEGSPESIFERLQLLSTHLTFLSWPDVLIGVLTLLILVFWSKLKTPLPSPVVAFLASSVAAYYLATMSDSLQVATIGSRFGALDFQLFFDWPWNFVEGSAIYNFNFSTIRALLPSAFAIAVLGGIESLLSATIADGMTQTKHESDTELIALGIGNILCPFFGGIAATGAIARTATNVRYGATSPIAAMSHAIFTLFGILVFAPLINYLPMAALAALLVLVAYNLADIRHVLHVTRVAPRSDVFVLWTCFLLTVVFDMVIGITAGVILAALLFMKRMAGLTVVETHRGSIYPKQDLEVPKDVLVYEISGPLFFGAAESAVGAIKGTGNHVHSVIFMLENVPMLDITGLVAFESSIKKLLRAGKTVALVGLSPQPRKLLTESGLLGKKSAVRQFDSLSAALISVASKSGKES